MKFAGYYCHLHFRQAYCLEEFLLHFVITEHFDLGPFLMNFRGFMGTGRELGNEDTRREVCKYQTRQEEVSEPRFSSLGTGDKVHFLSFSQAREETYFTRREVF